jgi:phosphopantothenoylcysteine decarboxylase/phosphopantothenate--cysteine ligase
MADNLSQYEILLGVSGGIAAYKAAQLCSLLCKHKAGVTVIMTDNAQKFIQPLTFSTLSRREVYGDIFAAAKIHDIHHISLTERADLLVVAPATANIIAKAAAGICDDLLSTLLCSADSEILLAPAMNQRMWNHPATQRNCEILRQFGYHFVGPESGRLACGDEGVGRMSEPEDIFAAIVDILSHKKPKANL